MKELERAIERGELGMALALAKEVARERGRPIDLGLALGLLPLVVAQQRESYDGWALRWLGRWISETPDATIEEAAQTAGSLAALLTDPSALETMRLAAPMRAPRP